MHIEPSSDKVAAPTAEPEVKAGAAAERSEGSLEARDSGVGSAIRATGNSAGPARRRSHKSGKTLLQKPFSLDALARKVRAELDGTG